MEGDQSLKTIRALIGIIALILVALLLGCSHSPVPGKITVAILDGTVQSYLLRVGIDVNGEYVDALAKHGAAVVRLSVGDPPEDIDRKLSMASGILVPGGFDIEPSRYQEAPDKKLEKIDPLLDELEFRALTFSRDRHVPVLGICRGCQALNVFYGGSLYQDIPSQYRSRHPVQHRRRINLLIYTHAAACYHRILMDKTSELAHILNSENIIVNTYHHQAARRVAPGFLVSARSADGSVEAIERTDSDVFILGTQFHPEKMLREEPAMDGIFRIFVGKASAWAAGRSKQLFKLAAVR
jgi:putative glutamine amidotransferase